MGTIFAPSFTNVYVGDYEENVIYSDHNWKYNIIFYKRYIDDLVFIWKGSIQDLKFFPEFLNSNDWGLTFIGDINSECINYLDVTFFRTRKNLHKKTIKKL